jgi:uracil-DNA glycosylase family 4
MAEAFSNFLKSYFGNRVNEVMHVSELGFELQFGKIEDAYKSACDKCKACSASQYGQDLPFWTGNNPQKDLMIIAQDAGKGPEMGRANTVFSLHLAALSTDRYFAASPQHKKYYNWFQSITGYENPLEHFYATDIVKCAYSTDRKPLKLAHIPCSNSIEHELEFVRPKVIVLMGNAARVSFFANVPHEPELVNEWSQRINKKSMLRAFEYRLNNIPVFAVPHWMGNLHVASEFKAETLTFQNQINLLINQTFKTRQNEK